MQYSQLIPSATYSKFAPDSTYFVHFDSNKLYVKDCSLQLKNIGVINLPIAITQIEISTNSKYIAVFMQKKSLIHIYKAEDCSLAAKIQDTQAGIVSMFWVCNSMQLLVFSEYMYKVSIYNLAESNMCYIKSPKFNTTKGLAFSSDGKFMALLEKHQCKDYLSVYYTSDWKIVNTFPLDLFDAVQVKWAPNDAYLIVADNCINYRLVVLSHMRGQVLKYEPYNFALGIKTVKFSNNSLFLAIGSFDEKIRLLNGLTWQQIGELDCSNPMINCQKILVHKEEQTTKNTNRMRNVQQKFYKINTVKIAMNNEKGAPNQGIGLLQFSQDDNFIACKNDNMPYTVWVWNVSTLQPISIINCSNQIRSIKWTKKENYLCIITGTERVLFWRQNGTIAECIFNFQHKKLNIQKIRWSNDGLKVLLSDKSQVAYAQLISQTLQKQTY